MNFNRFENKSKLPIRIQNDEECDTTDDHSSTVAGYKIISQITFPFHFPLLIYKNESVNSEDQ